MAKRKQFAIHLDPDLHRGAKVHAAKHDLKVSDVIEEALRRYLKPVKKGKS